MLVRRQQGRKKSKTKTLTLPISAVCVFLERGVPRERQEAPGECQEDAEHSKTLSTESGEDRDLMNLSFSLVQARQRATKNEKEALQTKEILASIEMVT